MTNKKLKNANIVINSKLAEFCEKYGKKTVAFLSKPCGPFDDADIIKVIEGIESCLEEKCCHRLSPPASRRGSHRDKLHWFSFFCYQSSM